MEDVNLRAMHTIRDSFGVQVGYSDHTSGIEVAIAAVALGASVIEKHLTLDRGLPGPDHKASLEPAEFAAMVAAIRNIEQRTGRRRQAAERERSAEHAGGAQIAGRGACDPQGPAVQRDNVAIKRPGTGMSPMRLDEVLGRPAPRDFARTS